AGPAHRARRGRLAGDGPASQRGVQGPLEVVVQLDPLRCEERQEVAVDGGTDPGAAVDPEVGVAQPGPRPGPGPAHARQIPGVERQAIAPLVARPEDQRAARNRVGGGYLGREIQRRPCRQCVTGHPTWPGARRPAGPRPPGRLAYSRKVEISEIDPGPSWAPQACTLPTARRPLRAAEFARLLASVQHIERRQPTWLHLDLDPSPRTAGQAAELAMA